MWGAHKLFYTFFTPLPTPSTLTRHLFPHSPNTYPTHLTRLSTVSHTHPLPPHTLSHFPTPLTFSPHFSSLLPTFTPPDTFLSPTPTLPHTRSHTSSQPPRLLQHFPILYHLPNTKFSHFFIYCQISTIKHVTKNSL